MLIRETEAVTPTALAMADAVGVTCRVLIGREEGAPGFAMRHFTLEPGGHTPLHEHNYEHEVFILGGRGLVRTGDSFRGISAGQAVYVAPNERHQFRNPGTEPLVFLCLVPVHFDCGNGTCMPTPGS